ncbi:cytochrome c [Myxococcus eversor]|uniref:cytochrome c n=1 Tax=Myxococcus eversor TaxID=2709661 RepID=UPI0013D738B2|nr:c-type cytochrome [Myxococcus eversor]
MKRVVALVVSLMAAGAQAASPSSGGEAEGARLFKARCEKCHLARPPGGDDLLSLEEVEGPDLSFAGSRLRPEWVESWLTAPARIRPAGWLPYRYVVPTEAGDRVDVARLPAHPPLSPEEARKASAYLATLKREPNPHPLVEPNPSIRAQVHFSKLLPCGGCHQAAPGQGGMSGPELYTSGARLDAEWMGAFLSEPGYWQQGLMPRTDARADQLAAIVQFLLRPREEAATPARATVEVLPLVAIAPVPKPKGRAEHLYRLLCSQCHGVLGNGRGINARSLFVAPRNHRSSQEMSGLTRDSVITAIRSGGSAVGKSTLMPPWGSVLGRADIELLAEHVLTLSGESASPGDRRP